MRRYFLDNQGGPVFGSQPNHDAGHVDIAREVLARRGITPAGLADHYVRMYALQYARIVEHPDQVLEIEFRNALTRGQQQFADDMARQGWKPRLIKR
jgi:hypothetical protein